MDIELFKQYKDIVEEIKYLRNWIEDEESKTKITAVVKESDKNFPYLEHNIIMENTAKEDRLKRLLKDYQQELKEQKIKIEEDIELIEDSRIRRIFRMRYLEQKSWVQIAHRLKECTSSARMTHKRYLEGQISKK